MDTGYITSSRVWLARRNWYTNAAPSSETFTSPAKSTAPATETAPASTRVASPTAMPSPTLTGAPETYQTYDIGDEIWGLAVADLNGDGTFGQSVEYEVAWGPHDLAAADLDGDSYPDLVSPSSRGILSVLINNGDGSFQDKLDYQVGGDPHSTLPIDMDADSDLDLLVAPSGTGTLSLFTNNGDGAFEYSKDYQYPGASAYVIIPADVDGDGYRELVASRGQSMLYIFPLEVAD